MNIKKIMIFLLIIALLTLCVPNVVAASQNKQTTEAYSSYATGASDKEQPIIVLMLSDNMTTINGTVGIYEGIATEKSGTPHFIGGAMITIQQLSWEGTEWYNIGTAQTLTGKNTGFFIVSYTPEAQEYYVLRAIYDGDDTYAPAASNIVALTVN